MDLWALARHQLESAGVPARRILGLDLCTFDNAEEFFSYRQFRRNGMEDGRQASFIWIR
jgi:copper oxidase (laccase) domain-containing protein